MSTSNMSTQNDIQRCTKVYEAQYQKALNLTDSQEQAVQSCAHYFLDGKPIKKGYTNHSRSIAFWKCSFWHTIPTECFDSNPIAYALAHSLYLGQADERILRTLLHRSTNTLKRGIRYSQIYLQEDSPSWKMIQSLADVGDDDFQLFVIVCMKLFQENNGLEVAVNDLKKQLDKLTVFEFLLYSSLFTFQRVVPERIDLSTFNEEKGEQHQSIWDALHELLIWKVISRPDNDLRLNERFLAKSMKQHLMPLLLPSAGSPSLCLKTLDLFDQLVAAVVRRNDFIGRSIHEFSYDDDFRYRLDGAQLTLYPIEIPDESEWDFNGRKMSALNIYWFNKAMLQFAHSDLVSERFGLPENEELNRIAFIKANRVALQLDEVYGMESEISLPDGIKVDLFKAIHSLELMSVFFYDSFIQEFQGLLEKSGNWLTALSRLMLEGIAIGENRFPLTWAEASEKAQRIKSWTVSDDNPTGDLRMAEAILEFWTNDLKQMKENLTRSPNMPAPDLCEKPIINVGKFGFQLPWLVASQNNMTAAVNNLRRIGSRRKGRVDETHRIESRLGDLFKSKGFAFIQSYQPAIENGYDPGEVDLICHQDGHLLILEIKSTYIRKTKQDAWVHRTSTLRKAAQQIGRKQDAVKRAIHKDKDLQSELQLPSNKMNVKIYSWIIDTSIEHDQEIIDGFLKVSLEGLIVILNNERQLLNRNLLIDEDIIEDDLYPGGFSTHRFVEIVENGELWSVL